MKRGLLRTHLTSLHWPILQQLLSLPPHPRSGFLPMSQHPQSVPVGPAVRHAAEVCQAGLELVAGQPAMFRVVMTAEYMLLLSSQHRHSSGSLPSMGTSFQNTQNFVSVRSQI